MTLLNVFVLHPAMGLLLLCSILGLTVFLEGVVSRLRDGALHHGALHRRRRHDSAVTALGLGVCVTFWLLVVDLSVAQG